MANSNGCNCSCEEEVKTPYCTCQPMYVLANHNKLDGRADEDCHPISAIGGLKEVLQGLEGRFNVLISEFEPESSKYTKGYKIIQNAVERGIIYIPKKSTEVISGTCQICSANDQPIPGLRVGDRYLDLLFDDYSHVYVSFTSTAYQALNEFTSNVRVTINAMEHSISADFSEDAKLAFSKIHTHKQYTAQEIEEAVNQGWN